MKIKANHRLGQYRSELFEEILALLLPHIFKGAVIERNQRVFRAGEKPRVGSPSVDFLIRKPDGKFVLVEAKAPYTTSAASSVKQTLKELRSYLEPMSEDRQVASVVLALASDIPSSVIPVLDAVKVKFASRGITLEVWDSSAIAKMLVKNLKVKLNEFSVPALEKAVGSPTLGLSRKKTTETSMDLAQPPQPTPVFTGLAGRSREVIVLTADFCSYSRFVHASAGNTDLITSIMGRFYRGARRVVVHHGGILDKFMGDGFLAYWIPCDGVNDGLLSCLQSLIGLGAKLAGEWQEQVDLSVAPKGMRTAATIGEVLFIPENPDGSGPLHAIGECINLCSRLQTLAEPNTVVISNRLRSRYYPYDDSFHELPPTDAKNIGEILAWCREF